MKYLLTGGGTGGHVYPALAIADEIRRRQEDAEFLYVGLRNKLESWVVPGRGYPIRFVHSKPFPRSLSIWTLTACCLSLGLGMLRAVAILLRFRPDIIICTGGYVSAPILFAYGLLSKIALSRAKVFLYEPNVHPGMLNQAVGRFAHRIGVAFEPAGRWFDMKRVAVVGYPVRKELLELDLQGGRENLDIPADKKVLFAFGGSGGARAINEAVVEALPLLRQREDLLILHVTGRYCGSDYDAVRDTARDLVCRGIEGDTSSWYRRFDYMDNIQDAYKAADLVICRGGASTLTEIGTCGLPALVVPKPDAAEDHQAINARELERRGAVKVLYQKACWRDGRIVNILDGQRLAAEVLALFEDEEQRRTMATVARSVPLKDSLELILCEIESLVSGQRPPPLNLEFPVQIQEVPGDPNALLRWAMKRVDDVGGVQNLDHGELAYLRYQADRLLVSEGWYEIPLGRRNVGVKLVGCLQYKEHLALLLTLLQNCQRVSLLRRLCGGDFLHGGLLRRNIVEQGIRLLGVADDEVKQVLMQSLVTDSYFEVRSAAAQVLGELFGPDDQIEELLIVAMKDRSPGVVVQAIRALGEVGQRAEILEVLERFYLHSNWQFRREVVGVLKRLVERGVLDPGKAAVQLDQILATSPYFQPEFPLNEKLRELAELCRQKADRDE